MDVDTTLKYVIPVFAAVSAFLLQLPSLRKAWDEIKHLRRDRRKKEAEFAAKLFDRCGDPHVKRYAEQLGYAALVGDNHLGHEERRFLLSTAEPQRAIDQYVRTFPWVRIYLSQGRIGWKRRRHESRTYRSLARVGYLLAYVGWSHFAGATFLFRDSYDPQHTISPAVLFAITLYFTGIGVPLALVSLRRVFLLRDAEKLIDRSTIRRSQLFTKVRRRLRAYISSLPTILRRLVRPVPKGTLIVAETTDPPITPAHGQPTHR